MLATSAQPLVLADGRLVYPDGSVVDPTQAQELVEIPTNREAVALVISARKKIADLPAVPKTMNTVSVVLSYTLFGLDDVEIALATGMTEDQVGRIKMHEAFTQMRESVVSSILGSEADNVRDLFQQHSRNAVSKLVDALEGKKINNNQILVARDFLDRAGHRPADVVEHRHKLDGGLTIEIIRREDKVIPTIYLEVEPNYDS
jgi:hypothetical protein